MSYFIDGKKGYKKMLEDVSRGNSSELKELLDWADRITSLYQQLYENVPLDGVVELFQELEDCDDRLISIERKVSNNTKKIQKIGEEIAGNNALLVVDKSIFAKIRNFLNRRELKKNNEQKNEEKRTIEKENLDLGEEKNGIEEKAEDLTQKIKEFFIKNGAEELGDLILDRREYYCREQHLQRYFDINAFKYNFGAVSDNIMGIPYMIQNIDKDLLSCSKMIQGMEKPFSVMQETKDFAKVCQAIRESFVDSNATTESKIETGLRKKRLRGDGGFWSGVATPEELPEKFKVLGERFTKIIDEQDETEFIKQCADFHFDFIQMHPYSDGNGRTARMLLSLMLASHDYLLPAIYVSPQHKENFYLRSNDAIKGNYKTIEYDLFQRLGHYYPIIIPEEFTKMEEESVTTNKNPRNMDDGDER